MRITLLENGLDSLKKGFGALYAYEEKKYLSKNNRDAHFHLKDAVLSIHHGIEMLLKVLLVNKNELLLFSNIDRVLRQAYREKSQRNALSVFATSQQPHTVTLNEAIDRLKDICGFEFEKTFHEKIQKIESMRNCVIHSEVYFIDADVDFAFDGLVDHIDSFFQPKMGSDYKTISGYGELVENYKKYEKVLDKSRAEIKKKALKVMIKAFKSNSISLGQYELRRITNIDKAMGVLNAIIDAELPLGGDFYNMHTTGDIDSVKRIGKDDICIFSNDNLYEYRFKFKSLLIVMFGATDRHSPLFFFEAANDKIEPEIASLVKKDSFERNFLEGIYDRRTSSQQWGRDEINNFHDTCTNLTDDDYYNTGRYLSEGIFCFLNIQGLDFDFANHIDLNKMTIKTLEVALGKALRGKRPHSPNA